MDETSRGTVTLPSHFRSYFSEFIEGIGNHVNSLKHKFYSIDLITRDIRDSDDPLIGTLKTLESALISATSEDSWQLMANFLAVLETVAATRGLASKFRSEASQGGVQLPSPSEQAMKVCRLKASVPCSDQRVPTKSAPADFDGYEVNAYTASQSDRRAGDVIVPIAKSLGSVDVDTQLQVGTMGTAERRAPLSNSDSMTQTRLPSFTASLEKRQQSPATERPPDEFDTPSFTEQENSLPSHSDTPPTSEYDTNHSQAQTNEKSRPSSAPAKQPHKSNSRSYQETSQGSSGSIVMTSPRTPSYEPSTLALSSPSALQTYPNTKGVSQRNSNGHKPREATHQSARESVPSNYQSVSLEEHRRVCEERDSLWLLHLQRQTSEFQRKTQYLRDELDKTKNKLDQKEKEYTELNWLFELKCEYVKVLEDHIKRLK